MLWTSFVFFFSEASQFDRCFFSGKYDATKIPRKATNIKQREAHQIGRLEVDQKKILKGGIDKLSTLGGWAPELLPRELAIGRQSRLAVTYPCNHCNPFFYMEYYFGICLEKAQPESSTSNQPWAALSNINIPHTWLHLNDLSCIAVWSSLLYFCCWPFWEALWIPTGLIYFWKMRPDGI